MSRRDQLRERRRRAAERPAPVSTPLEPTWPLVDRSYRPQDVLETTPPVAEPQDTPGWRPPTSEPRDAVQGISPVEVTVVRDLIEHMNGPQLAVVIALAFTRAREIDLTISSPVGVVDVPTWRLIKGRTEVVGRVWWENGEWRTR